MVLTLWIVGMKKGKSFWLVEEVLDASSPFHACPSKYAYSRVA